MKDAQKHYGTCGLVIGALIVVGATGCGGYHVDPPVTTVATYDVTNELAHTTGTLSSSAYFAGQAGYYMNSVPTNPTASDCVPVDFSFAGTGAKMVLTITDTDGVLPGDSFSYSLTQSRVNAGNVQPSWTIVTFNPSSAASAQNTFIYTFTPGSPTYPLSTSASVAGTYTLDGVERPMSVSLSIHTTATVPYASIAGTCTNPH